MPYSYLPENTYLQINGDQIEMMNDGTLLFTMTAADARSNAADLLGAANRIDEKAPQWRVGRKVPINIYDGNRPVCQCHNEKDAKAIVGAMNAWGYAEDANSSEK